MVGRNRHGRLSRQFQEPSQLLGLAPEFLTNGGNLAPLSFRLNGAISLLSRSRNSVAPSVSSSARLSKIAEPPAEPAQTGRLRFLHPFPRATPQG
jgi:hypothetical protein